MPCAPLGEQSKCSGGPFPENLHPGRTILPRGQHLPGCLLRPSRWESQHPALGSQAGDRLEGGAAAGWTLPPEATT